MSAIFVCRLTLNWSPYHITVMTKLLRYMGSLNFLYVNMHTKRKLPPLLFELHLLTEKKNLFSSSLYTPKFIRVCFYQVLGISLRYLEEFVGLTSFVLGLSFRQNLFKYIWTPETLANADNLARPQSTKSCTRHKICQFRAKFM